MEQKWGMTHALLPTAATYFLRMEWIVLEAVRCTAVKLGRLIIRAVGPALPRVAPTVHLAL